MGKLAEAYVDIVANTKNLDVGLARARAGLSSFVGFAGAQFAKVGALAGVGSVGGIAAGFAMAARKAADLGETVSKVGFVFGKSAKIVTDNSDELAKNFGAIKRETLDAAAAFGLMAQAAGYSKEKSAQLGAEFVKLGLDAASFFNVTNEEAFTVLRSGLAGETEPLRRFGVLLSEAALQSEAVALGIAKTKRELTDVEKVQARVSLIRKGLAPATGDLERTSSSTANQLRKLQGDLENAVVQFGEDLQGAMVEGLKLAKEISEVIRKAVGGESGLKAIAEIAQAAVTLARVSTGETGADAGKVAGLSALSAVVDQLTPEGGPEMVPGMRKLRDGLRKALDKELGKAGDDMSKPLTAAEIQAAQKRAGKSVKAQQENLEANPTELSDMSPAQFFKHAQDMARLRGDAAPNAGQRAMEALEKSNPDEYLRLQSELRSERLKADQAESLARKQAPFARFAGGLGAALTPASAFKGLSGLVGRPLGNLGELAAGSVSGDKKEARGMQQALAGAVGGFLGQGLTRILVGTLGAGAHMRQNLEHPNTKTAQTFSGEDYASHAIQAALEQDPTAKQQLDVAKSQLEVQQKMQEALQQNIDQARAAGGPQGVFPRSRG